MTLLDQLDELCDEMAGEDQASAWRQQRLASSPHMADLKRLHASGVITTRTRDNATRALEQLYARVLAASRKHRGDPEAITEAARAAADAYEVRLRELGGGRR